MVQSALVPAPLFTGGNHICIVTRDLDRAVRMWWDRYGVGPWRVFRYDDSNMAATVEGQPARFAMRAALAQLGPGFRIEIIQPLDERSPYASSLAGRHDADHIHHVRFDVSDFDEAFARMRDLGLDTRMHATFAGGAPEGPRVTGAYLGTEADLGFTVEIAEMPAGFSMPEPEYVYPAEG
jgi:methylmalonyl-CoA/ethylmalonyl-CoA epimerase